MYYMVRQLMTWHCLKNHPMKTRNLTLILLMLLSYSGLKAQWEPVRYDMDIEICFDENRLVANCLLTVRNDSGQAAEYLPLRLNKGLQVIEAADPAGNALSFEQEVTSITGVPPWQVNAVRIALKEAANPGELARVRISYSGAISDYQEIMGYVRDRIDESFTILREDAFAYPSVGGLSMESLRGVMFYAYDYRVSIRVPRHLVVANGGNLVEKTTGNGFTTYTYENIKPAWRMDFAIGEYEILDSKGFRVFYFPSDGDSAKGVMESAQSALRLYTGWFGPLKGAENFSIIQIPEGFGSQADVTSILQTADAFLPDQSSRTGLYHELAHLWHPMENETFSCRWNEGHATFLQYLAAEVLDQSDGLVARASNSSIRRFAGNCRPGTPCAETPLVDYGKKHMTDNSYTKGMVLFHVLYELIGKESFMNLFRENYRLYAETGQTTEDLVSLILALPHPAMPRFVQEWFYGLESNDYLLAGKSVDEIVELYRESD
jgi:hypothetical protein